MISKAILTFNFNFLLFTFAWTFHGSVNSELKGFWLHLILVTPKLFCIGVWRRCKARGWKTEVYFFLMSKKWPFSVSYMLYWKREVSAYKLTLSWIENFLSGSEISSAKYLVLLRTFRVIIFCPKEALFWFCFFCSNFFLFSLLPIISIAFRVSQWRPQLKKTINQKFFFFKRKVRLGLFVFVY